MKGLWRGWQFVTSSGTCREWHFPCRGPLDLSEVQFPELLVTLTMLAATSSTSGGHEEVWTSIAAIQLTVCKFREGRQLCKVVFYKVAKLINVSRS